MSRMLVSFQYNVAALVDRRILLIHCAVCEEVFQAMTEVSAKEVAKESPELVQSHPAEIASQLKDFPLLLKVLSLGDGIEIENPPELIVKWSNIAAICNLSDEQWTAIKKPPRKRRKQAAPKGAE
jgi:hypothetical protein